MSFCAPLHFPLWLKHFFPCCFSFYWSFFLMYLKNIVFWIQIGSWRCRVWGKGTMWLFEMQKKCLCSWLACVSSCWSAEYNVSIIIFKSRPQPRRRLFCSAFYSQSLPGPIMIRETSSPYFYSCLSRLICSDLFHGMFSLLFLPCTYV